MILQYLHVKMNITEYWPLAREFSIRNAAVASLQFWTAGLNQITLGIATEEVYSELFYLTSTYTLHQQPDEILFGHFMTTLNAAFEQRLVMEDDGYESSSEILTCHLP